MFCKKVKAEQSNFIKPIQRILFDQNKFKIGNHYTIFELLNVPDNPDAEPLNAYLFSGILTKHDFEKGKLTFITNQSSQFDDIKIHQLGVKYNFETSQFCQEGIPLVLITIFIGDVLGHNLDIHPMYTSYWNKSIDSSNDDCDDNYNEEDYV